MKFVGKSDPRISVVKSPPSAMPVPRSFAYKFVPIVLFVGISITIESVCAIVVVGVSLTQIKFLSPQRVTKDWTDKVVNLVPYTYKYKGWWILKLPEISVSKLISTL